MSERLERSKASLATQYQSPEENPELFQQRRMMVAESPDGRYQVLAGKKYRNLLLHDTKEDLAMLLVRDLPYSLEQKILFIDNHRFCIDSGEEVDFYNARTGEHVEFLEMQFGHKDGQKTLLGFVYDEEENNFAALFLHEEPANSYGHKYWAALFNREGKLLDDFRTDIDLVQIWGKIVAPKMSLSGENLLVWDRDFTADYLVTFFDHSTAVKDKSFH